MKDEAVPPQWAWELIEPHLRKSLANQGVERPTKRQFLEEFARVWPAFTATIMVQEPWMGTIRFKRLARLSSGEMGTFLEDPTKFIGDRFGGGKFKMNLHHGLHFVNTKNFKPDGPPLWKDLPELAEEWTMASDETRRLLKEFGIAVTDYEDAVAAGGSAERLSKAEAQAFARLREVSALLERLRAKKK